MEGLFLTYMVINLGRYWPAKFIHSAQYSDAADFYGLTVVSQAIDL
jgi:hypothetical protein